LGVFFFAAFFFACVLGVGFDLADFFAGFTVTFTFACGLGFGFFFAEASAVEPCKSSWRFFGSRAKTMR
jgi:hypothetical protein